MDQDRLRELAGITVDTHLSEEYTASVKELELLEKMYQGKRIGIDTDEMSIEEIQKRLDAASRALGIANRLRDPAYRTQHLSRVMSNMNTIRAALHYMIKQDEEPAEVQEPKAPSRSETPLE